MVQLGWYCPLLAVTSSGNVGIGTSTPGTKLDVVGDIRTNVALISDNPFGSAYAAFSHRNQGNSVGYALLQHSAGTTYLNARSGSSGIRFRISNADKMVLASSGNFGIGTTIPGAKLGFNNLNDGSNGADGITWYNPSPTAYGIFRTAGPWTAPNYQQLRLEWQTGITLNPGTVYGKSYVDIQGGGLRVTSGNVGIGTTGPSAKLDVVGTTELNGNLNVDSGTLFVNGSNNKVGVNTTNTTLVSSGTLFVGVGHVITNNPDAGFIATKAGGGLGAGMDPEPATNRLRWFNTNGVEKMSLADNGNLTISGVYSPSDARLKTNVQPLTNPLDIVLALRGVTFNRISDETQQTHVGLIAQEVEQVLPEVVITDHAGYKSVAYANIVSVLVEAIKEQQA